MTRDRMSTVASTPILDKQRSLVLLQQKPLLDFKLAWLPQENRVGWDVNWFQSPRVQGIGTFVGGTLLSAAVIAGSVAASVLPARGAIPLMVVVILMFGVFGWGAWSFHTDRVRRRRRQGDVLRLATDGDTPMVQTMFGRMPRQACVLQLVTGRTRPKKFAASSAPFWYGHAILVNDGEEVHVGSWVKGGSCHQRALAGFAEFNGIKVVRSTISSENALEEYEVSGVFVRSAFG